MGCHNSFSREIKEHDRSVKLNRLEFCSRGCAARHNIKNFGDKVNRDVSKLNAANRKDQYTGFRYYFNKAKARHPTSNITLLDIKELWETQKGKCAYTYIPLILRKNGKQNHKLWQQASLDRIDSALPYNKDNVAFVSLAINYLKNTMTWQDTMEFLTMIKVDKVTYTNK